MSLLSCQEQQKSSSSLRISPSTRYDSLKYSCVPRCFIQVDGFPHVHVSAKVVAPERGRGARHHVTSKKMGRGQLHGQERMVTRHMTKPTPASTVPVWLDQHATAPHTYMAGHTGSVTVWFKLHASALGVTDSWAGGYGLRLWSRARSRSRGRGPQSSNIALVFPVTAGER